MPFHDVKQGETLLGLAVKNGLESWQDILDRPENAELKKKRPDPGILKAGDRVFIPNREMRQEASEVDAKHSFKISRPKAWLRLAVKDAAGEPLAGKKYELAAAGTTASGKLPADGVIEQAVPVDATEGRLTVWAEVTQVWNLKIGWMDPLDEMSGVQARLNNLGCGCGEPGGILNEDTQSAIRAFQALTGLQATGEIDGALREKLGAFYGPDQDETTLQVKPEKEEEEQEEAEAGEDLPPAPALVAHVQLCKAKGEGGDKLRLRSWVEVQLVGEDDSPIPDEKYVLTLPGGKRIEGALDKEGRVRVDGIPPGPCQISFPGLDKDAWARRAKKEPSAAEPLAA